MKTICRLANDRSSNQESGIGFPTAKRGLLLAAAAGAGLFFTGCAVATSVEQDTITKTFPVSSGGRLVVDADRGSIDVITSNAEQVAVVIRRKARAPSKEDAQRLLNNHALELTETEGTVTIRARNRQEIRGFSLLRSERLEVAYELSVPRRFNLELATAGGHIRMGDLEGDFTARTAGGSIEMGAIQGMVDARTAGGRIDLKAFQGPVRLKTAGGSIKVGSGRGTLSAETAGGSIHVERIQGDADLHTSGGSIEAGEVAGNLDARTAGGSIHAGISLQPTEDCQLETSGGNITLRLLESAKVALRAKTTAGKVTTALPVEVAGEIKRDELTGTLNGGGALVDLRTSAGSISIEGFKASVK